MVLTSEDVQALDLLSAPNAPVVGLQRRIEYLDAGGNKTLDSDLVIGFAVWWAHADVAATCPGARKLEGEIHLAKDLAPSSAIGFFSVKARFLSHQRLLR
jgi:hypothetical protein